MTKNHWVLWTSNTSGETREAGPYSKEIADRLVAVSKHWAGVVVVKKDEK